MERLLDNTEFALKKQHKLSSELKTLGSDLLAIFMTTHQSMRLLIKQDRRFPLLAADGVSLSREQVEKLYTLALIIEEPKRWIRQYLRNNWKAMYEGLLLDQEECKHLSRITEFVNKGGAEIIERMRHWPSKSTKRGYEVVVSDQAKRAIRFRFFNPSQYPPYFPGKKFNAYFLFPTPYGAMRQISNPLVQEFLKRWYKEYQYYSGFSHVLADKMQMQHMSKYKSSEAASRLALFRNKLVHRAITTSYTAAASACTITAQVLIEDFGVASELKNFWQRLDEISLWGKLLWRGYASKLL